MCRLPGHWLVCAFLPAVVVAHPGWAAEPSGVDRFADSLMTAQLATQHVPGAVLVVVRDGQVALARGYGFADLERRIPVSAESTAFRVASVSKLVTATAVMQLEEQGRLDLHADVNTYLTKFRVPSGFGRPVRLFDLLTHTAGFDDRNIGRKARTPSGVEPLGDYLARSLPPRVRRPGEFIAYSNHGMALAGYVVEVTSGMPFERYVRERILAPLGMTHSGFELTPPPGQPLASGYEGDPPRRVPLDYTKTIPASMFWASGADMGRFMLAHLEGGQAGGARILGEAAIEAMHRRQFTQHDSLPGVGFAFWERFQNGERAIWHDGDAAGFASLLVLLPERHTGYFMAFNSRAGNRARREILAALLDRDFPRPAESAPPRPIAQAPAAGARCAGTYTSLRYGHRSLERLVSLEQQVRVAANADGSLELGGERFVPIGGGVYQRERGEGRIAFRFGRDGRATHLFEGISIARVSERVPWWETARAQLAWLLLCVAGFAWCLLDALARLLARLARRRVSTPAPAASRLEERLQASVSLLNLGFLAGFALALTDAFGSLEYGVPRIMLAILALPIVSIALTVLTVAGFAGAWRRASGAYARARLAYVTVAATAFVPWLALWNLVGWRF